MSTEIELPIIFKDCDEPSILRDRDIIALCPVLERAIQLENSDWKTKQCIVKVENAITIPFQRAHGDFMFTHALKYEDRDYENSDVKLKDYPEANEKSLGELKQILGLADFLECYSFMHSIGFVIAKKLEEKSIEEMAAFLGVKCEEEEEGMLNESDGWIHTKNEENN